MNGMLLTIFTAFFDEFANNQLFGIIVILMSGCSCALLLSGVEAARKPKAKTVLGERTGCTVLAIDDSPMNLHTVKSVLSKRGFNVLTSSSAPKGLNMIRYAARDIHIVMLDYSMPRLNGDETLKYIKQLSPNAKVIGLTSMKFNSLPREYIDGIDKLLSKPVVATKLIDTICELLGEGQTASSAIEK
jgi:CheY-like chemotaxis protein